MASVDSLGMGGFQGIQEADFSHLFKMSEITEFTFLIEKFYDFKGKLVMPLLSSRTNKHDNFEMIKYE